MSLASTILVTALGPTLLGLAAALIAVALRGRSSSRDVGPTPRRGRVITGVALVLVVLAVFRVVRLTVRLPLSSVNLGLLQFASPLVAGLLVLLIVAWPGARRRTSVAVHQGEQRAGGAAELSRRSLTTYVSRGWLVLLGPVVVAVLALTIVSGASSEPDGQGRFVMYEVVPGPMGASMATYGWFFSVPCLVLLAVLIAGSALLLRSIALPPLEGDPSVDGCARRRLTNVVLAVVGGALLLHLGAILAVLAQIAGFTLHRSGESLTLTTGSSFAAFAAPLRILTILSRTVGWFLWWSVLLVAAVRGAGVRDRESVSA